VLRAGSCGARSETSILQTAAELEALGARIIVVGFGAPGEVNRRLIEEVASDRSSYFEAADASALVYKFAERTESV